MTAFGGDLCTASARGWTSLVEARRWRTSSASAIRLIEPFLEHALTIATDKVALLARLTLLEGQRRSLLLERTPLVRVLLFAPRVSMPPGDRDDIPAHGRIYRIRLVREAAWLLRTTARAMAASAAQQAF